MTNYYVQNATLNIFGENDGTINIVVTNGSCLEEGSVPGISESRTTDLVMTRNGLPMSPFSEERSMPETPETFGRSSRRNRNGKKEFLPCHGSQNESFKPFINQCIGSLE